ncbi:peptidylprolyl isomerase [Priestia megaterium]|nr:peptidylprolyl isomerase [Priestia megaterium]
MKKLRYPFIIGLMAVALAACGSDSANEKSANEDKAKTAQTDEQDQTKQAKEQQKQMEEMQKKLDKQKVDDNKTVAVVNDEKILGLDYNQALTSSQMQLQQMGQDPTSKEAAKQVKNQAIDNLVGQTLLLQDAKEKGYKASNDEIDKQIADAKKQYKTEKEFNAALKQANLDMEQLKAQVADNIQYTKYVEKEIPAGKVTDQEIQSYYDQYTKQGESSDQKLPKLEEVKPQIKQQLEQQKKNEKIVEQVKELKKNAKIDVKI